jgi:hypothetical protein
MALIGLVLCAPGDASASAGEPDSTTTVRPLPAPAQPAAAGTDTLTARGEGLALRTQVGLGLLVGRPAEQPDRGVLSLTYPTFPTSFRHSMWKEVEVNRFEAGLMGADRGAFAGAALGFLGTQTGVMSDRTSWLLMGAGAALGALWGGLQPAEERRFHIRVEPARWEPADMLRYDPRERDP